MGERRFTEEDKLQNTMLLYSDIIVVKVFKLINMSVANLHFSFLISRFSRNMRNKIFSKIF